MNARSFLVSSGITYIGAIVAVLVTVAFYVVSLRINPEGFGELQSILSIMFLLLAGRTVAGSYVVIHAAENEATLGSVVRQAAKLTVLIGCAIGGGLIFLAPYLRNFLHLESLGPFLLIGFAALPSIAAGMLDGILNVQKRFAALSVSAVFVPLANFILAFLLFQDGFQEIDAGWIVLGAQCFSCLNALLVDWSFLKRKNISQHSRIALRESAELFAGSLLFGAAVRIDVLWAKHVLTPEQAGSYAIAASIAIVIYLITNSVTRVASVSLRSGSGINVVLASYALIIVMSAILAGGFRFIGGTIVSEFISREIHIEWAVLWPLFIGMALFSIITLDYTCLNVVTKRVHVGIGVVLIVLSGGALFLWGNDGSSIALIRCWSMTILTFIFSYPLIRALRQTRSLPVNHPAEAHLAHQG